jgi:hypothetical protein
VPNVTPVYKFNQYLSHLSSRQTIILSKLELSII